MTWRALSVLAALLLAGPAPLQAQAPAPPAPARPAAEILPRIVVQAMLPAGFDVAAWTADSRYVITASGLARELLLWEVARGIIVDRVRLPTDAKSTIEAMRLSTMVWQPDGRTLRIDGEVLDPTSADLRASRAYLVNINTRQISMTTPRPLAPMAPGEDFQSRMAKWIDAMTAVYGEDADMTREQGLAFLPPLPRSPDGRWDLVRHEKSFALKGSDGRLRPMRAREGLISLMDAALSPDDRRIVLLTGDSENRPNEPQTITPVEVIDITSGRVYPRIEVKGDFDRVEWIDARHYALLPQDDSDDPLDEAADGAPDDVVFVDADRGVRVGALPARCFMAVMPGGVMFGAGLGNCRSNAGRDFGLARLEQGVWQPLRGFAVPRGAHVRAIAASPRGDRVAVALRLANKNHEIHMVDPRSGASLKKLGPLPEVEVMMMSFSPDGTRLWVGSNGTVSEWQPDAPLGADGLPALRDFPVAVLLPQRMSTNGTRLMVGGAYEERIQLVDLAAGTALRPVDFPGPSALGYMRTRPVMWAASTVNGLRLWDQRSGRVLMTISFLPNRRYVVVAPDGRYDTNMGPDSENFRWLIPDQPFRSLAPQTLMRDYYEPQLIAKLMDCTRAGNCARVLHKVPPVTGLNRQLPLVKVAEVRATAPGMAEVDIVATETRDATSGIASGVFGIKLLMNNREIARNPDEPYAPKPANLAEWRSANFTQSGDDKGNRYWTFTVPIPTDGRPLEFSAYSFNADRVKSDTARLRWTPPPAPPRPRRAYVLTIGVNDYVEPQLTLNFAVPDAQLIAGRLASIPGYEMRHASLTTTRANGRPQRMVSDEDVSDALSLLAGMPGDAIRQKLKARGHDVAALAEATPDDIVIISYSGHGHAGPDGSFALVPSNARWALGAPAPQPGAVIDADDLTMWLRAIKAAEIAFIIDACHSGAAVNTPDFKPGPMGDPGLGQLAFDKGLRILAATQADDVALENASLAHGFLTAALGEGLTPEGGPADLNGDQRVGLDEWLRYAVARLPSLHEEVRSGGGPMLARGVRVVMRTPGADAPRTQEPSLFDFNSAPSPVFLRRAN